MQASKVVITIINPLSLLLESLFRSYFFVHVLYLEFIILQLLQLWLLLLLLLSVNDDVMVVVNMVMLVLHDIILFVPWKLRTLKVQ
jgi:hypothetical protein